MNIDKPLDEIIATNKRANGRRGGRGGAGGGAAQPARVQPQQNAAVGGARARYGGNAPRQNNQAVVHPLPKQQQQSQRAMPLGEKIIVSNLPDDVTEAQIRVSLFVALSRRFFFVVVSRALSCEVLNEVSLADTRNSSFPLSRTFAN